jgi:soluble lytic murein transglycosylase-like protein
MLQSELINEGKLTNTLAAAGLAAGLAHGNVEMKPVQGYDTKYNSETPTLFQVRHNHDFDADQFSYRFNQLPNKIEKTPYDSLDIQATIEKIFATPDSILTKYGRKNAQKIAEFIVKATDKYDIDENILLAILSTETGFNQEAVSHTGVKSIAQITSKTFNSLQQKKKIDKSHSMDKIVSNVEDAIYAAADIINYFSKHMHNNIEMIFAEYNGGTNGGASPYRMYRQGMSKEKIINWMKKNDCSEKTIKHFFDETIPYVEKCMRAYKYYLAIDDHT